MATDDGSRAPHPLQSRWLFLLPGLSLLAGLGLTLVLVLLAHHAYAREEARLLRLRVRDAATVVSEAVLPLQSELATTAVVAEATGDRPARLRRVIAGEVAPTGSFTSIGVWVRHGTRTHLLARAAAADEPELSAVGGARIAASIAPSSFHVVDLLRAHQPSLGYAYASRGGAAEYVVLAESRLQPHRRAKIGTNSAFAGFSYAIYLGGVRPADLIATSARHLPLTGETGSTAVPFGTTRLFVVLATRTALAGALADQLPWIIGAGGTLLSLLAAIGVLRLAERRRRAERLAEALDETARENERLYAEQRTIAETLQHALLPDRLPQRPGLETGARYEAGVRSIDIGGDWYDVLELPDRRLLLVVGDVSGRGLRAATTMASLRYAIHAYAAESMPPERILACLSHMLSVAEHGQLATVLLACLDFTDATISVTSAGHLPPLLLHPDGHAYIEVSPQIPVGIDRDPAYEVRTVPLPPSATLLAFTDGLVERRGETLDAGLQRLAGLAERAAQRDATLDAMLGNLVADLVDGHDDDIAIVGLRWTR